MSYEKSYPPYKSKWLTICRRYFKWMNVLEFWLKCQKNVFMSVTFGISQHLFMWWLGVIHWKLPLVTWTHNPFGAEGDASQLEIMSHTPPTAPMPPDKDCVSNSQTLWRKNYNTNYSEEPSLYSHYTSSWWLVSGAKYSETHGTLFTNVDEL